MEYAGKTVRGVVKPKNLIPWLIGLTVFSLSGVGIVYFLFGAFK